MMFLLLLLLDGPPYYQRPIDPVKDLDTLQQQIAQDTYQHQDWLTRIGLYTTLDELNEAYELIVLLNEHQPDQPVFREARMILESSRGNQAKALAIGDSLLKDFPNYPTARINLARIYLRNGKLAPALNLMITALEQGPLRPHDWRVLLRTLARSQPDPQKMITSLEQKSSEHPQLLGLKYMLVVCHTRLGDYQKAAHLLRAHPALAEHQDLRDFLSWFPGKQRHEDMDDTSLAERCAVGVL